MVNFTLTPEQQARREERQTDPGAAGNSDDEKTESDTVETSNVVVQFLNIFRMMWKFTSTEMVALLSVKSCVTVSSWGKSFLRALAAGIVTAPEYSTLLAFLSSITTR